MQQKGCHTIQAEGDADLDIVKATVTMSYFKSTTLIGEDTDLLVLLLYYASQESKDLYFRSDKDKETSYVYDIKALKQLLGDEICSDLLFAHAFSGSDTTSRVFGVGKKTVFINLSNVILCYELVPRYFVLQAWIQYVSKPTDAKQWCLCLMATSQSHWNHYATVFYPKRWPLQKAL